MWATSNEARQKEGASVTEQDRPLQSPLLRLEEMWSKSLFVHQIWLPLQAML